MEAILNALAACGKDNATDPSPAVAGLVRASNAYPVEPSPVVGSSHASLSAAYPQFAARVAAQRERIAVLLTRIVDRIEPGTSSDIVKPLQAAIGASRKPGGASSAANNPDLSDAFDFLDRLRESAESFIDEAKGQHSSQQVAVVQGQLAAAAAASEGGGGAGGSRNRMPQAKNLLKSQLHFEDGPIDNSRDTPFVPRVGPRYHGASGAPSGSSSSASVSGAPAHPYEREINGLAYQPWQLQRAEPPSSFARLDDVECMYVNTPALLAHMVDHLEGSSGDEDDSDADAGHRHPYNAATGRAPVREIAIDLEAHSLRSFQGFTCLMQLSTRGRDFLVDTLALRAHLHLLNRLTTDPTVVKVLHGCDSDVVWLQRDFGLWLVNVFDTGQASRVLAYPSFGLAYLLQRFAGVTANKQFQTADWRERPLPPALLKYAREDTHYLLGIYDRLRNELVDKSPASAALSVASAGPGGRGAGAAVQGEAPSLLAAVLDRSRERSLLLYDKERFDPAAYRRLMVRLGLKPTAPGAAAPSSSSAPSEGAGDEAAEEGEGEDGAPPAPGAGADADGGASSAGPASPRTSAFAALYDWRDAVARSEDESTHYVLPNRLLARLAELRPANVDALVRACNPIPPLVRSRAAEVVQVILGSRTGAVVTVSAAAAAAAGAVAAASAAAAAAGVFQRLAGAKRPSSEEPVAEAGEPSSKRQHVAVSVPLLEPVATAAPPGGWLSAPVVPSSSVGSSGVRATTVTVVAVGGAKAGAHAAVARSSMAAAMDEDDEGGADADDVSPSTASARVAGGRGIGAAVIASSSAAVYLSDSEPEGEAGAAGATVHTGDDDSEGEGAPLAGSALAASIRAALASSSVLELLGVMALQPPLPPTAVEEAPAASAPAPAPAAGEADDDSDSGEADAPGEAAAATVSVGGMRDERGGAILSLEQRYRKPSDGKPRKPKKEAVVAVEQAEAGDDDEIADGEDGDYADEDEEELYDYSAAAGGAADAVANVRASNQAEADRLRQGRGHRGRGGRGGRGRGGRGRGGGGGRGRGGGGGGRGGGNNPYIQRA